MATQYKVHSGAVNTTAAPVRIATGTVAGHISCILVPTAEVS